MKTGLVMEGGAMRGMFTAGVIDILMENDITFDGAIGVSAGAAFGCNIKSKQIGRAIRYNMKYCNDPRYCGIKTLLKTGNIFSKDFAYGTVPLELDPFDFDTYINNPMDFYMVCTDIKTGKPVYHNYKGTENNGFDWVRASSAMPLVSEIVEIDGKLLLDGGVSDSIPLKYFQEIGYEKNIVILTQPPGYSKEKNKAISLMKVKYRKYPNLIKTAANRHICYNNTLAYINEQEALGNTLVIQPQTKLPVSRVEKNPDNLKNTYDIGRQTATNMLPQIKKFLEN